MFTGIVEALGKVETVTDEGGGRRLRIVYTTGKEPLLVGESVAVNGCCLTVVTTEGESFEVQAGPETLVRTNLGELVESSAVNLERALRPSDRMGGHFVQGHVDTTAVLVDSWDQYDWRYMRFRIDPPWTMLMVEKGSIAVDGVSLTLISVGRDSFELMLIPHTAEVTTLGSLRPGQRVNIETDLLAKHIRRLMGGLANDLETPPHLPIRLESRPGPFDPLLSEPEPEPVLLSTAIVVNVPKGTEYPHGFSEPFGTIMRKVVEHALRHSPYVEFPGLVSMTSLSDPEVAVGKCHVCGRWVVDPTGTAKLELLLSYGRPIDGRWVCMQCEESRSTPSET